MKGCERYEVSRVVRELSKLSRKYVEERVMTFLNRSINPKICRLTVLGPQMATKKAINLMKVNRVIKGLATIPETYHAHI